jgi:2-(1,2-epoxy-1,2-dihydrophenyl)acetyl-CoA isomerase
MSAAAISAANGVLRITLDRPEKLNAIDGELADAVRDGFERARADASIRAVLLAANGRAFCAGQDLADPNAAPGKNLGLVLERHYNPLIRTMRALPKPIVARVNGVAAGAGANLAFAADIVVAARSASFIESFSKIGLLPDSGGTWMLPRLVGQARATAVAMLGERFSAKQAQAWGAIWQAVDDDQLDEVCERIVAQLAQSPTLALAAIKSALQDGWMRDLDTALEAERDYQSTLGGSDDFREGVEAFSAKRQPSFRGR